MGLTAFLMTRALAAESSGCQGKGRVVSARRRRRNLERDKPVRLHRRRRTAYRIATAASGTIAWLAATGIFGFRESMKKVAMSSVSRTPMSRP
jgi:hypothetical protein